MKKNKLEWRIGFQMKLSDVITYSVFERRREARVHMQGMKKTLAHIGDKTSKIWMERHETTFKMDGTKTISSFSIINSKRVR